MDFFNGEGGSRKVFPKRSHGVLQNDLQPNNLFPIHGIKEEVADELGAEKHSKPNLSTAKRVKYGPKAAYLSRKGMPNADRKQVCDFFEPDGSDGSNTHVLQTCMTLIKGESDPLVVCTLFAGALAACYPSILQTFKNTLIGIGVDLNIIYLPKQANENFIDLEANDEYDDSCESYLIIGVCVCILFKNISDRNYSEFISNRRRALASMFGITKSRLAELKQPVTMNQAKHIRGKLGSDNNLKKELLLYLMALADCRGPVESFARYLCTILSWNEMSSFVFVREQLYQMDSPVLSQVQVRDEVVNFKKALTAVGQSQYPQFFCYFCSADERKLVQSIRFPVLAAVARRLKFENSELLEEDGRVVELVKLHNAFIEKGSMELAEAVRLLANDPEVAGYRKKKRASD